MSVRLSQSELSRRLVENLGVMSDPAMLRRAVELQQTEAGWSDSFAIDFLTSALFMALHGPNPDAVLTGYCAAQDLRSFADQIDRLSGVA